MKDYYRQNLDHINSSPDDKAKYKAKYKLKYKYSVGGADISINATSSPGSAVKLERTLTSTDLSRPDNPSAYMNIKASIFRDILMDNNMYKKWDLLIGWFLNVCLQKDMLLRDTLHIGNVPVISYRTMDNGKPEFIFKQKDMILMNHYLRLYLEMEQI